MTVFYTTTLGSTVAATRTRRERPCRLCSPDQLMKTFGAAAYMRDCRPLALRQPSHAARHRRAIERVLGSPCSPSDQSMVTWVPSSSKPTLAILAVMIRLPPGSVLARIGHTRADAQGRLLVDKGTDLLIGESRGLVLPQPVTKVEALGKEVLEVTLHRFVASVSGARRVQVVKLHATISTSSHDGR
jgi:hypothetical protein